MRGDMRLKAHWPVILEAARLGELQPAREAREQEADDPLADYFYGRCLAESGAELAEAETRLRRARELLPRPGPEPLPKEDKFNESLPDPNTEPNTEAGRAPIISQTLLARINKTRKTSRQKVGYFRRRELARATGRLETKLFKHEITEVL